MEINIRKYRLKSNLTVRELGRLSNYSKSYISEIERIDKYLNLKVLESIAPHLEVCMKDLFSNCKNKGMFPDKCKECCGEKE